LLIKEKRKLVAVLRYPLWLSFIIAGKRPV